MPVTPNRARWADVVDDSGDEMMAAASDTCRKEEDEQMPDGEVSPAASFCSTQFSWNDEPFAFDAAEHAAPSIEWTQNASLPPPVFAACPIFPVEVVYPSHMPMQAATQSGNQENQAPAGCLWPVKKGRTDPVRKRFLKQGSQDGKRRPLNLKQNTKELASRTLPEASEEDWQRRLQKRHNIVATVKETPEYQAFSAHRGATRRATLRTPSPNDKSVSKRQWEEKVHKWRTALRNWNQN
mmetsp:Transcript_101038/g.184363  ORF Transcript_101038/g.184363 Transcript_101038/m.184363 type:complete len:239 (+) Transcript_101038:80-796(+)